MLPGNILRAAVNKLQSSLPPGWSTDLVLDEAAAGHAPVDGLIRLRAPDGRAAEVLAEARERLTPRLALGLAEQVRMLAGKRPLLVVAPWMSATTRGLLVARGINVLDLTGNAHIVLSSPGLFIDAAGAEHDPWPEARRPTLKGAKAARVVRALCVAEPPLGVRALAARAKTTPGYVSKLLDMLDDEAVLSRSEDGKVEAVDLARLLARWARDAPIEVRTATTSWIDPRGLTALLSRLRGSSERYAVTGSLAARRAPVAAARLATIYTSDPESLARSLGLRPAEAGANVQLLVPDDGLVFEETWEEEGVRYAALPQVAADLLSGPGRGPAEAEALIAWMIAHRGAWRG